MSTNGERRTQVERRNESENSLLDAAAASIAARGVERASLAEIGDRAGRSRGLANHHFGSKEVLIERLVERCQDRLEQATETAWQESDEPSNDALAAIRLMVDMYLSRFATPDPDIRALLVLWGASFPEVSSVPGITRADERASGNLANLVELGQKSGSISAHVDPVGSAVMILGLIRGVAAQLLTHSDIDLERIKAEADRWLTTALAPAADADRRPRLRRRAAAST